MARPGNQRQVLRTGHHPVARALPRRARRGPAMTGAALLDAALSYAERRGWPVFPVALVKRQDGKLDKKPLVKWGAAATTDAKQIKEWWRRWPNALVGVPTGRRSGLVVLDVDCKFDTANGFHT